MLQIRSTQFHQFENQADRAERDRIVAAFHAAHPGAGLPEPALHAGIDHAHRHHIQDEGQILRFLVLRWQHGDRFDLQPWAQPLWSAEPDEEIRLNATVALLRRLG